ncbi:MAG: DUF2934 domain-containing protein [Nitrospira sp.]|nr:MAG: DUF2934 domain-containing protein [Nitrospira sp.]
MSRREKKGGSGENGAVNGTSSAGELLNRINQRAHELYRLRGEAHGHDTEDWLEAERQIWAEVATGSGG